MDDMAYSIRISLSKKKLYLMQNGSVAHSFPVAIGKKQTPTPVGRFTIISKAPKPGGVYGAYWLGLSLPHHGIHGTNNPASIGKEISGGCIRMHNQDVGELASYVSIGTPVHIAL